MTFDLALVFVLCVVVVVVVLVTFVAGYWAGENSQLHKRIKGHEEGEGGWEDEVMFWRTHAWPIIEGLSKTMIRKESNGNSNDSTT